ncbi:MAG TPA: glycoside-pentoside-hexuronide (GPH):cation symporter [Clostridia bacterium]|nr:glycoside-pentoside-hexuronide (GPH):cation symporter [Clostridia bacterium]
MIDVKTTSLPRMRMGEKLGFLAFSSASNVVYQFKSLYYLFFLTNIMKVDVLLAGAILTIGTIWDAVNDPLIGFWAVNHRFKNGESCRPLALWFAVPWAVTVVLLFTDFGLTGNLQLIAALLIYLVFELFNTYVNIPYNSMGSLATDLDADRRSINVFRNLGGCLGSGIGAVACLPLLKLFGGLDAHGNVVQGGASSRGFMYTAVVMGAVCILGCFAHYFTTKERVKPIAEKEERLSAKAVAKMLFSNRSWVLNMLYIICYNIINLLLMTCLTYYATYVMKSTGAATSIQVAYLVAAVAASFLVSPIDKALGRKKTMLLAALIFIVGKLWFVLDPFSVGALYVNAATVGIAVTITFVMFSTNRNNIVDIIEWKNGRRLDSLVSTADNLVSKLAVAGATQLITVSMYLSGFDAGVKEQPAATIHTINAMIGWVPMVVAMLMFVVLMFLDVEKDTKKMLKEKALAQ